MKWIMKRLFIKLFLLFFGYETFLKLVLKLHSIMYVMATTIAIKLNKGIHPKHQILNYKEWFLSEVEEGAVVLDVGSNDGKLTSFLADKAKYVYGVEINSKLHKQALLSVSKRNVKFINTDATTYDYRGIGSVDTIILSNVLEHIQDRIDFLKKLLSQVVRENKKLKILIRLPMIDRDWIVIMKKNMGVEWRLDKTHFTEYTLEQFMDEMRMSGILVRTYKVCWGEIWAVCETGNE